MFDFCNYTNNKQELLHQHKDTPWWISLFKCNYKNNEQKLVKEHKNINKKMQICKWYKFNNSNWRKKCKRKTR